MEAKLIAWIQSPASWALLATFVIAGLQAVQSNFTGNVGADIGVVVSVLGLLFHPVNMTGGRPMK